MAYLLLLHLLIASNPVVNCAPQLNHLNQQFHETSQPLSSFSADANGGASNEPPPLLSEQFLRASSSSHLPPRSPLMQLRKLTTNSNNITCNDGSQVGYYERLNSHSKSWVIYLQGGGFCGGQESCQQRWARSAHLMSSKFWPKTKTGKWGSLQNVRSVEIKSGDSREPAI